VFLFQLVVETADHFAGFVQLFSYGALFLATAEANNHRRERWERSANKRLAATASRTSRPLCARACSASARL
jgi:hypothetical protein